MRPPKPDLLSLPCLRHKWMAPKRQYTTIKCRRQQCELKQCNLKIIKPNHTCSLQLMGCTHFSRWTCNHCCSFRWETSQLHSLVLGPYNYYPSNVLPCFSMVVGLLCARLWCIVYQQLNENKRKIQDPENSELQCGKKHQALELFIYPFPLLYLALCD